MSTELLDDVSNWIQFDPKHNYVIMFYTTAKNIHNAAFYNNENKNKIKLPKVADFEVKFYKNPSSEPILIIRIKDYLLNIIQFTPNLYYSYMMQLEFDNNENKCNYHFNNKIEPIRNIHNSQELYNYVESTFKNVGMQEYIIYNYFKMVPKLSVLEYMLNIYDISDEITVEI